jgi:hypothetical protein
MCFGFRFTVVMYRGHILGERENIFDIADIDGNRRGGSGLFLPPIPFAIHPGMWRQMTTFIRSEKPPNQVMNISRYNRNRAEHSK